jgi:hypothetical protein
MRIHSNIRCRPVLRDPQVQPAPPDPPVWPVPPDLPDPPAPQVPPAPPDPPVWPVPPDLPDPPAPPAGPAGVPDTLTRLTVDTLILLDTLSRLVVDTLIVTGTSEHIGWEHYRDGISVGGDQPTSKSTVLTKDGVATRQVLITDGVAVNGFIDSTGEGYFRSLHIMKGDLTDPSQRVELIGFDSTGSRHSLLELYTYLDPATGYRDTTWMHGGWVRGSSIGVYNPNHEGGVVLGSDGVFVYDTLGNIVAAIDSTGEGYFRSLHILDAAGNRLVNFNADGTSEHSGLETYYAGIRIPLENGNVLELSPLEGLTIKSPTGAFIGHLNPLGDFFFVGTKNNIVETPSYGTRRMYALEAADVRYTDFGSATLRDGEAIVPIDPIFLETVTIDAAHPPQIILTPGGDCAGLYVARKAADHFVVRELGGGRSSVPFDYQISAHRRGYEDVRLERHDPHEGVGKDARALDASTRDPRRQPAATATPAGRVPTGGKPPAPQRRTGGSR